MSHYVYMGATPLALNRASLLPQAAPKSLKDLSPAQKRQAVKNNRSRIIAEFRAKGVTNIIVNDDGTLHLKDFASDLDAAARALLNTSAPSFKLVNNRATAGPPAKPVDVINALPLSAEQKRALTQTPFSTAFNGVTAILTVLNDPQTGVITNVLKKTGSTFDLSTFPFNIAGATRYDISLVQPGDELFDGVSQAKMLRLRTLTAFLVLFWRKWAELHAELAKQGLDWLFAKEDVKTESTIGTAENTLDTPYVVDRIPNIPEQAASRQLFDQTTNSKGQAVFRVQTPAAQGRGTSRYYILSPKGLYDRAVEMQRQWDAKYQAYKNDKITNAAGVIFYGPRMTFLRSQGKTETQARNIIASEDNFPSQFQKRGVDRQFIVLSDRPDLGGGLDPVNGPRPSDAFINRLKAEYEADLAARVRAAEADAAARKAFADKLAAMRSVPVPTTSTSVPTSLLSTQPRVQIGSLDGNYVSASGLGAAPAAGFVAAMAAIESFCVACPVVAGLIVVGVLAVVGLVVGVTYLIVMGAMGRDAFFFLDVKEGKVGGGQAKDLPDEPRDAPPPTPAPPPPPRDDPRIGARGEPGGGAGPGTGAGTGTSGEGGFPVVPVALAAGLALFLLARR